MTEQRSDFNNKSYNPPFEWPLFKPKGSDVQLRMLISLPMILFQYVCYYELESRGKIKSKCSIKEMENTKSSVNSSRQKTNTSRSTEYTGRLYFSRFFSCNDLIIFFHGEKTKNTQRIKKT